MGLQGIKAQSMGSENITYYQCENDYGDSYFSTSPCPASEFPEVCITACSYCHNSMSCESLRFHHCHNMPSGNDYSDWGTPPSNPSTNNSSVSTGGGGGSSNGNTTNQNDNLPKRNSDDYDFGHPRPPRRSISKTQFLDDLDKTISDPSSINQGVDGTCGAAVIEKLLAELFPIEFDKAAMNLYNTAMYQPWGLILQSFSATDQDCNDKGKSTVDMIFQTAITQANNYWYNDYDPMKESNNNTTSTWYWKIESFLQDNIGLKVETLTRPTYFDIQSALNDGQTQFVIAFVNVDDNKNFTKGLFGNHYVQILGVTQGQINYWSWGQNNQSNSSEIYKLYKIKK